MITTIQLNKEVKLKLEKLKESKKETYEQTILKLINSKEESKRKKEELIIEGCKEMAKDNLKITKEWEHVDTKDWEW